ncbi:hypothetical protein BC937DRAFT_90362 [Endogone sp. FLAS-F59071]|nr:hypothetical protein BC937DRAFT_90362 [Endogone sp. FLAS-F59071]|eukprot:RUS22108.1 hypothetical protein BC937DRAFT_90362 [Endogone sp. FLAS-F59071]
MENYYLHSPVSAPRHRTAPFDRKWPCRRVISRMPRARTKSAQCGHEGRSGGGRQPLVIGGPPPRTRAPAQHYCRPARLEGHGGARGQGGRAFAESKHIEQDSMRMGELAEETVQLFNALFTCAGLTSSEVVSTALRPYAKNPSARYCQWGKNICSMFSSDGAIDHGAQCSECSEYVNQRPRQRFTMPENYLCIDTSVKHANGPIAYINGSPDVTCPHRARYANGPITFVYCENDVMKNGRQIDVETK